MPLSEKDLEDAVKIFDIAFPKPLESLNGRVESRKSGNPLIDYYNENRDDLDEKKEVINFALSNSNDPSAAEFIKKGLEARRGEELVDLLDNQFDKGQEYTDKWLVMHDATVSGISYLATLAQKKSTIDGLHPYEWAVKNDGENAIVHATDKAYNDGFKIEGQHPLEWAVNNGKKVEGRDPILGYLEHIHTRFDSENEHKAILTSIAASYTHETEGKPIKQKLEYLSDQLTSHATKKNGKKYIQDMLEQLEVIKEQSTHEVPLNSKPRSKMANILPPITTVVAASTHTPKVKQMRERFMDPRPLDHGEAHTAETAYTKSIATDTTKQKVGFKPTPVLRGSSPAHGGAGGGGHGRV